MSFDEVIYRDDKFTSIEMSILHSTNSTKNHGIEDELKSYNLLQVNDNSKRNKNVRFPEDENLVSDYFEAKNYWQDHTFCSNNELIMLYKKACHFYNIKPIQILLEQLKNINVGFCNDRYDILNLSNLKLDLKHIESMEEIFKHIQFKTLNFENSTLDDDSAASLFEIIEYYQSCFRLNLSYNGKISYAGFNAFSKMLKKTSCLETIELRGIMFTDTMIPSLNRALRFGSHLKILHLESSNICSKNLLILTSALKLNVNLRELHLSGNKMVPSDGMQLGSLLKVNKLLKTLDVRNNSLGDAGLSHLCAGLFDQCKSNNIESDYENEEEGLACLILWNNSLSHLGMSCLSRGLKVTKSLKSLNLGNNAISSEGIHILREGLLLNRSLFRLSLSNCRITCEGGIAIAEYLADTNQLMRLDIRNNDIRTAGLLAISLSMKVNTSIIRLDVDLNPKKDPNIKSFFETQSESLKIIQRRVQENKRVSVEQQELELLQSFTSLSNQPQSTPVVISDVISNGTALNDLTNIDELSCSNSEEMFQMPYDIDSVDLSTVDINEAQSPMSLELSTEADSSMMFFNDNFNQVLSPTDKMLERENSESIIAMEFGMLHNNNLDWDSNFLFEQCEENADIKADSIAFVEQTQLITEAKHLALPSNDFRESDDIPLDNA